MSKPTKEALLEPERFELKPKSGGGLLSYEVWGYVEGDKTVATRYNLTCINHAIHQGNNGPLEMRPSPMQWKLDHGYSTYRNRPKSGL